MHAGPRELQVEADFATCVLFDPEMVTPPAQDRRLCRVGLWEGGARVGVLPEPPSRSASWLLDIEFPLHVSRAGYNLSPQTQEANTR